MGLAVIANLYELSIGGYSRCGFSPKGLLAFLLF
jgi:hypothetical protein